MDGIPSSEGTMRHVEPLLCLPRHLTSYKSSRAINRGHLEEELAIRAACALHGTLPTGTEATVVEERP
jgi:hypothetical protein